jgi:hypothetical protein
LPFSVIVVVDSLVKDPYEAPFKAIEDLRMIVVPLRVIMPSPPTLV